MAKKKTAKKKVAKVARDPAQLAAEAKREKNDQYGKTLVRHDAGSAAAMKRIMKRMDCSAPEALRLGVIELDKRRN